MKINTATLVRMRTMYNKHTNMQMNTWMGSWQGNGNTIIPTPRICSMLDKEYGC